MDALLHHDGAPRISIEPPLPCAMGNCGRPAAGALVERDEDFPELWRLLPVCDACFARLRAGLYIDSVPPASDPVGATD